MTSLGHPGFYTPSRHGIRTPVARSSLTTKYLHLEGSVRAGAFRLVPVIQPALKSWHMIAPRVISGQRTHERVPFKHSSYQCATIYLHSVQPVRNVSAAEARRALKADCNRGRFHREIHSRIPQFPPAADWSDPIHIRHCGTVPKETRRSQEGAQTRQRRGASRSRRRRLRVGRSRCHPN